MPWRNSELKICTYDLLNVIECIEFFIHASKVKMHLYAFWHQIGDETLCQWVIPHLSHPAISEQQPDDTGHQTRQTSTIRLQSNLITWVLFMRY